MFIGIVEFDYFQDKFHYTWKFAHLLNQFIKACFWLNPTIEAGTREFFHLSLLYYVDLRHLNGTKEYVTDIFVCAKKAHFDCFH